MKDDLKELKRDFKEVLSVIDFTEYDPFSKVFMKASFIGQMWLLLKTLYEDDEVGEEIEGAEKYIKKFEESGDTQFRDMAKDELRHAGILIKKNYEWADDEKKAALEQHENKRQELLKKLSKEE